MSFNWAPVISKAIALAKQERRAPYLLVLNPVVFSDLRIRMPKVYSIGFDSELDQHTFDGVPIILDDREETYRLV